MKKIGKKKAIIAVARKLAVTMHRMLITEKPLEHQRKKRFYKQPKIDEVRFKNQNKIF